MEWFDERKVGITSGIEQNFYGGIKGGSNIIAINWNRKWNELNKRLLELKMEQFDYRFSGIRSGTKYLQLEVTLEAFFVSRAFLNYSTLLKG